MRVANALAADPQEIAQAISSGIGRRPARDLRACTLEHVKAGLRPADKQKFNKNLLLLRRDNDRGEMMLRALKLDCRIAPLTWLDLIQRVLNGADVVSEVRAWGERHLLEGPLGEHPGSVGRASEHNKFKEDFIRYSPLGPLEAEAVLQNLEDDVAFRYEVSKPASSLMTLGGRPTWCTFSTEPSEQPFEFLSGAHNPTLALRSALGLETRGSTSPPRHELVLMTYDLPITDGRFPTTADAAKYEPWNYYFNPASEADLHGWTCHWDRGGLEMRGRPELVHESVSVADLTESLKVLR